MSRTGSLFHSLFVRGSSGSSLSGSPGGLSAGRLLGHWRVVWWVTWRCPRVVWWVTCRQSSASCLVGPGGLSAGRMVGHWRAHLAVIRGTFGRSPGGCPRVVWWVTWRLSSESCLMGPGGLSAHLLVGWSTGHLVIWSSGGCSRGSAGRRRAA